MDKEKKLKKLAELRIKTKVLKYAKNVDFDKDKLTTILSSFVWKDTPEGMDFWISKFLKVMKYEY